MQVLKFSSKIDPDGYLRLDLPTQFPGETIELVVVINPVQGENEVTKYDFSDLAGNLTWRGDAVATQRNLRDEW